MQRQTYIMLHARAEHAHAVEWDTLGWILHFFHHKSREGGRHVLSDTCGRQWPLGCDLESDTSPQHVESCVAVLLVRWGYRLQRTCCCVFRVLRAGTAAFLYV